MPLQRTICAAAVACAMTFSVDAAADPITIVRVGGSITGPVPVGQGISGVISPVRQGNNQTGNGFSFNPSLGTLLSTTVQVGDSVYGSPTMVNYEVGKPVFTFVVNQKFDLSQFGLPDATKTDMWVGVCAGPTGICYPGTYNYVSVPGGLVGMGAGINDLITRTSGLKNGGLVPFTIDTTVINGTGTLVGTWQTSASVAAWLTYEPKSVPDYIADAIALGGNNLQPGDLATSAAGNITRLRTWDAATSSQNLNLRDAEYWLMGYAGGLALRGNVGEQTPGYNLFLGTGPLGLYYWKQISQGWSLVSGGLPGTPTDVINGGYLANLDGWIAGLRDRPLSQAAADYGDNILHSSGSGSDSSDPIMPITIPGFGTDGGLFDNSLFEFQVPGSGSLLYIDPAIAQEFTYAVTGNEISGILLPPGQGGEFTISFSGHSFEAAPGEFFNFLTTAPDGVESFRLSWNGTPFDTRPLVGLEFRLAGTTFLDVTTAVHSDTPEPTSTIMTVSGLLSLAALALVRRTGTHKVS